MKYRKIIYIISLLSILLITDFLFYSLKIHFGPKSSIYKVEFVLKYILLFLFIISLLTKNLYDLDFNMARLAFFLALILFSFHISRRLIAVDKFYYFSKNLTKKNSGNLWQFDELLGHRSTPNSKGTYIYYIGDSIKGEIPVLFDSLGYRTVPDSLKILSDKIDLYLGCSFTFGDFVKAEYTYPFLASKMLGHNYINAGASAYGFGQMFQIANWLIPRIKFTYVFIQLSPWLADRAMNLNGPTFYGYHPFPYFSENNEIFKLNPPAYKTAIYTIEKNNWRETKASYLEKLRFSISDGFRIQILDYYAYKWSVIKVKLGIIPKPANNKKKLEQYFYDQVIDLSKKNSAIPIVLKLNYELMDCKELISYLSNEALVIDLDEDLDRISNYNPDLRRQYFQIYHVQGPDTLWYDDHPNSRTHSLYADKIYNQLKKNSR